MDIFEAAKEGNCSEILKHVDKIGTLDKDGNTALMLAASYGHLATVRSLIRSGAHVNALGKGLNSALSLACKMGRTEVVKELLFAEASVSTSNEDGETPLHQAIKHGHENISGLLLDHGADINARDKTGSSLLYLATNSNSYQLVKILLHRGVSINLPFKDGATPLVQASCSKFHELVLLLLENSADPNLTTSEAGNSALYWSSRNGEYATAKALLDAGANPCHMTKSGYTSLSITADELMKRMIRTYQTGGPSWLVQQLCARGLEWPDVCDIEDKLRKEGFVSKEIFLAAPMSLFTHEYLRSLGILHFGTRLAVITVRLEGTWLGARLAALGVTPFWIRSCETCVFEALGCGTEAAFANLPAAALSAKALKEVGVPVQYHLVLRALHEQLNKAREEKGIEKEKGKKKKHSSAASLTSGVTNSATAETSRTEHTAEAKLCD